MDGWIGSSIALEYSLICSETKMTNIVYM
uniref:Uncharacterized protein n=1 Tax=Anguilla anguilla TaxID=7936 RepID=A0A0E9V443_ANGAN